MKLVIRKASKKDFPSIRRIFVEEFGKSPYNEKWTLRTSTLRLRHYQKIKEDFFVAVLKKEVVGFLIGNIEQWDKKPFAYVYDFAISAHYQRNGIGSKMLSFVESYYKGKGADSLVLIVTLDKKDAVDFYKKRDYKETGEIVLEKDI